MELIIIPHKATERINKGTVRVAYSFLYGKLKEQACNNVFGFQEQGFPKDIPRTRTDKWYVRNFPEGVYPCTYEGQACTFFCWEPVANPGTTRGLVVLDSARMDYLDAEEKYNNKEYTR